MPRSSSLQHRASATGEPEPPSRRSIRLRSRRRSPAIDPELRESLELAAANIGAVAEAQLDAEPPGGRAAPGPDA